MILRLDDSAYIAAARDIVRYTSRERIREILTDDYTPPKLRAALARALQRRDEIESEFREASRWARTG